VNTAHQHHLLAASALLMREVVCEQIYRSRSKWNESHPNRALGVRSIHPDAIADAADMRLMLVPSAEIKALAALMLDADAQAWRTLVKEWLDARDAALHRPEI